MGDREADVGLTTARHVTTTEVWGDGRKESYVYRLGDGSPLQQTDRQLEVLSFYKKLTERTPDIQASSPLILVSRADSAASASLRRRVSYSMHSG